MKNESGIVLGIELSSRQGSVALLKDGVLLAEKKWVGERVRHNPIFQTLETLLEEAGVTYRDISLYAVGRGPGSFSGMRMSFAIAQALALPEKMEVRAVSSGAALALAVAREGAQKIAVVGDARREQFWVGSFSSTATAEGRGCREATATNEVSGNERDLTRLESPSEEGCPAGRGGFCVVQTEDWKLIPYNELVIPAGTLVVSPEAERLTQYFPTIGNARFPLASDVAALALMQDIAEPLEPLYMHPPVFIEPKYS
jgi:tRNA threonylcarbamoyl adenosine modification protein YeaZ